MSVLNGLTLIAHHPSYLLWALAYLALAVFFHTAASPLVSGRRFRKSLSPYSVFYFIASLWIFCGLLGHTPWWSNTFDFSPDEPASLLMPLFWGSMVVLLFFDFLHYTTQTILKSWKFSWFHRFCSTKIKISFGRTFSESALSSLAVAAFCCVLHARNITNQANDNYKKDMFHLLVMTDNQTERVSLWLQQLNWFFLYSDINTITPYRWLSSPIFGVWMSLTCVQIVHHWFDRTCEERALFWNDDTDYNNNNNNSNKMSRSTRRHQKRTNSFGPPGSPTQHQHKKNQNKRQRHSSLDSMTSEDSYMYAADEEEDTNKEEERDEEEAATEPVGMMPMASWYEYSLIQTILDLFIHSSIFAGRFDMRHLLSTKNTFDDDVVRGNQVGTDSDPHYHDHTANKSGSSTFTMDFMADCGDGFNSSYTIARLLAQPTLRVSGRTLSRGNILLIGGDLAYPNPTRTNYEERFCRVFEDAMQQPVGRPAYWEEQDVCVGSKKKILDQTIDPLTPRAYVVPGNHDWFDGLNSFLRYVVYRDRLGGWFLPQTKTYFALALPKNWYIFGLDDGLDGEIDARQFAYFSALSETLSHDANVIIMNHQPVSLYYTCTSYCSILLCR